MNLYIALGLAAVAVAVLAALMTPYAVTERQWQKQKATDLTTDRRASDRQAA